MMIRKYIVTTLVLSAFALPAMAKETDHIGCEKVDKVSVVKMGMVDEAMLKKHIDKMEESLDKVKRKAARREEHRQNLKAHLAHMQDAMKEVHNLKLKSGCLEAAHGATAETRMMLMEQRMSLMQSTIEQMLGHQKEIERE